MGKKLTEGERRAARKPGVGGDKPGLWPNMHKARAKAVKAGKTKTPGPAKSKGK